MDRIVEGVRHFFDRHALAGPGIVAVSGGADSVALLRILHELEAGPLVISHVNHLLRGEESHADEAFVCDVAAFLGIEVVVHRSDVAKQAARQGTNLEATARQVRYTTFHHLAMSRNATWVATAHTADDQAETLLHRLLRGTGIQGLRGIAPVMSQFDFGDNDDPLEIAANGAQGQFLIRPLLHATRAEVQQYLESRQQPYRTDSSNVDPRFTRNRIRHDLLPLMKTYNPEIVSILGRLAEQAGEAFEVLELDATQLLVETELPRAGDLLIFDAVKLATAHPYRVREVLRYVWHREGWPRDGMTFAHWQRLAALTPGDYPDGIRVRRTSRVVQIGKAM